MRRTLSLMWISTKKEFWGLVNHPTATIVLVVFIGLLNFFAFRVIFVNGVASIRPMLDIVIWILLFIVPAVTMKLIAEEKHSQTLETTLTRPVREWHMLAGKAGGATIVIGIGILLTLIVPLSLSSYGSFDWGMVFVQYVALILLVKIMVAVGLFASSFTKNQIIAFLTGAGLLFFLVVIGFDFVTSALPASLKSIAEQLSILWHFTNMTRGVIDLRDLIYFVTVAGTFFAASTWFMVRDRMNAKRAYWRRMKLGLVLLVALAVLINLLGSRIGGRLDLTANNLYTLSPATKDIIHDMNADATITLYASAELPPSVSVTARDVKDLLNDYASHSNGSITFITVAVTNDNAMEAESNGITPVQFNVLSSDEFQAKRGYFGLTVAVGDQTETIPYIDQTDDFEYTVSSYLKKLTSDSLLSVGFLSGHGEHSPYSDYASFGTALSQRYTVTMVTWDADAKTFSQTPDVLIVAGPTMAVSDEEQQAIRDYITGGGRVFFLIDTLAVDEQTLDVTPNENSLADLVAEYGATVETDIVGDALSNERITLGGGAFNYIVAYPFWVKALSTAANPIVTGIDTVSLPWASSIVEDGSGGTEVTDLLTTSNSAFLQTGSWQLLPDQDFSSLLASPATYPMAASITPSDSGARSSAFTGRIVVIGDADFLTEGFVQSTSSNAIFALNAVDWLSQDDALISVRSKQRGPAQLLFENDAQKTTVRYLNLIGVPLLIAVVGGLHLYRRKRRARRTLSV